MPNQNRLLETIRCENGRVHHLPYHQARMDRSRQAIGLHTPLKLELSPPEQGLYRCRIIYLDGIESIEYLPYIPKPIKRFKLIHSDISYSLKYENREEIDALLRQKEDADEIIIIKNGLITDTSIANLCFFDGKEWLSPKKPLLEGTTRQRLLDEKKIKMADISYKDISKFTKVATLNAMVGFYMVEDAIIV